MLVGCGLDSAEIGLVFLVTSLQSFRSEVLFVLLQIEEFGL